jgi:nitrogen fixation NifU-like protein
MEKNPRFAQNKILDHFYSPRNCGEIAEPDGTGTSRLEEHGIAHKFTLRVEDGRIADIKFKTAGCVSSIASASAITELVKGRRIKEAYSIKPEEISTALDGLPLEKMYCARLAVKTLRRAIEDCMKEEVVI